MVKICKHCGKENKEEFDFCVYCGQQLPKHLICPICKKEYLEFDYEYCGKCGGQLVPIKLFKTSKVNLELSEKEEIAYNFWNAFLKEAEKTDNGFFEYSKTQVFWHAKDFCIKNIDPNFARFPPRFYFGRDYIECKLHIAYNKPLFDHLHKRKRHFEREFGSELIWEDRKGQARNIITRTNLSIDNVYDWDNMISWYIDTMNKFAEVFSEDIIEFAGTIGDNKKYQYWLKFENELSKTNLKNLSTYNSMWNYKDIGFSDIDYYYGYITLGKFLRKRPIVKFIIRSPSLYECILEDKEIIESELGFKMNWNDNRNIIVSKDISNNPEFEDEIIKWQINTALKIDKVISKRIKEFVY